MKTIPNDGASFGAATTHHSTSSFARKRVKLPAGIFLGAMMLAGLSAPRAGRAADASWNGTVDSTWSNSANWSAATPGTGNNATFNNAGNGKTTITVGNISLAIITFDTSAAAAYIIGPSVGNGDSIAFDNGVGGAGNINMTSAVVNNELINANILLGADSTASAHTFTNSSTTGTLTIAGNISGNTGGVAAAKTLTLAGAGNSVISGTVGNGGATSLSLALTGGTWTLSNANTFTGTVGIGAATLRLTNFNALSGSGAITMGNNSFLQLRGNTTGTFAAGNINLATGSAYTIDVNNNGSGTGNTLTMTSNVTFLGANTLGITGGNGYTLALGAVTLGGADKFNPTTGNVTLASIASGANVATLSGSGNAASGTNAVNGAITSTIAVTANALTIDGTSVIWALNGTSAYVGNTTLTGGTLAFGASTTGPAGAVTGGPIGTGSLMLNGAKPIGVMAVGGAQTIGNTIFDNQDNTILNVVGSNNLTFSGTLNYASHNGMALNVTNTGTTTFSNIVGAPSNTRLGVTGGGPLVISSYTGGGGTLIYSGSNQLNVTSANTTGTLVANSGTFVIGSNTGTKLELDGGVMKVTGTTTTAVAINGGTFQLGASNVIPTTTPFTGLGGSQNAVGAINLAGFNQTFAALTIGNAAANAHSQGQIIDTVGGGTLTLTGTPALTITGTGGQGAVVSANIALGGSANGTQTFSVTHSYASNNADLTVSGTISSVNSGVSLNIGPTSGGVTVLSGTTTYTGTTIVASNNIVRLQSNNTINPNSAGIQVVGNGELQLAGGFSHSVNLNINSDGPTLQTGQGGQSAAVDNVSGNNTLSGTITLAGGSWIAADSGTLTISGAIGLGANQALSLNGVAGTGIITGSLNLATGQTITKLNSGTWILAPSVTGTLGSLAITSGQLVLDETNMASGTAILGGGVLNTTMSGGSLILKGNSTTAGGQTLGSLTLTGNTLSSITVNPNGNSSATLAFSGQWGHGNAGVSLLVDVSAANSHITDATVSGLLGWVLVKDTSGSWGYALGTSGVISRFNDAGATTLANGALSGATNYSTLNSTGNLTLVGGAMSVNSLAVDTSTNGGGTLDLNNGGLSIAASNSGGGGGSGVLFRGAANQIITNGTIGAAGTEFIVHQLGSGTLQINAAIGSTTFPLTLDGGGVLALGGVNTYTGNTVINAGTLLVNGGSNLSGTYIVNNGMLQLGASNVLSGSNVVIGNAPESSGTFNLAGFNQTINNLILYGANSDSASQATVSTSSGTLTLSGTGLTAGTGAAIQFNADTNIPFTKSPKTATINGNLALTSVTGTSTIAVQHSANAATYTNTDVLVNAAISGTTINLVATNTGAIVNFAGTNTYTGSTLLNSNVILIASNNSALGASGAGTVVVSGATLALAGNINIASEPLTISGVGVQAGGMPWQNGALVNASGTNTFGGAIVLGANNTQISSDSGLINLTGGVTGAGNTLILTGSGNGAISNIATTTGGVTKAASSFGTWTLNGVNSYTGATTINGGALAINGNNTNATGAVNVNASGTLMGTGTIGSAVTVVGSGAAQNRGTLSLVDGKIGTLTLTSGTASLTLLTIGDGNYYGGSSNMNVEVGSGGADQLNVVGTTEKVQVNLGGVNLNIVGIGGLAAGTYNIINGVAGGITYTGTFTPIYSGNFGGNTVTLGSQTSGATTLQLIVTAGTFTSPTTAYWSGAADNGTSGTWNSFVGGNANTTNWVTAATGGVDPHALPTSVTDVFFSATTGTSYNTTLGQNFNIKGITFNGNGNAVTVNTGTNTLTLGVDGLTVVAGAPAPTITGSLTGNVNLGATQTWTVNGGTSSPLTVNSIISGSGGGNGLTVSGTGMLVLGGNNTFTNGLTIGNNTVKLANAGALNSTSPNAVTFAASSTGTLALNGNSVTIGALSTNATAGSPVVQNGGTSAATLTVNQSGSSKYAGTIQDGGSGSLGVTVSSGTLNLAGGNTYSGSTNVSGGVLRVDGSLGSSSAVSVNSGTLMGSGTIGGAVSVATGATLTAGTAASPATLTLSNGLTIANNGIILMNVINGGANDFINITSGGLTASGGANSIILQVSSGLTTGTYNLIAGTGMGTDTSAFNFQSIGGGAIGGGYSFTMTSGTLQLVIGTVTAANPSITITTPNNNQRVMQNGTIAVTGLVGNSGPVQLNGTFSSSGQLTYTPGTSTITVASSSTNGYTGSVATGNTLGNRTLGVAVTDGSASPSSTSATITLDVLQDRTVSASSVAFGSVHAGTTQSGTTGLTTTGADSQNTRVTVANTGSDSGSNNLAVSGGNPTGTFNSASSTDSRTLGGTFSTLGSQSGTVTLTTTGESGVSGQNPINVGVGYSVQVFSGTAAWASGASGAWSPNGNWGDLAAADLGGAGAPGLAGAASATDTATFGDVTGSPANITVSLNGVSPTLAGMTFNSTSTTYTIATGTGTGTIVLNNAATPINVTTSLSPTISAVLSGNGLNKTGSGLLILSGTETYSGSTFISGGTLQTVASSILPSLTTVSLGSGTGSGVLVLGTGATAGNQTVNNLTIAGTGTANAVVGGASVVSTLTVNPSSGSSAFAGNIGGAGTNQNNLSLVKNGASTFVLTGSNSYTGSTILTSGTLGLGSANALSATGTVNFNGGALQFSSAYTTDLSNRFTIANNGSYSIDTNGQSITFNTALTNLNGINGLTKSGSGILTLGATETYTGTTNIVGGVLQVSDMLTNSFLNLNNNGNTQPYSVLEINSSISGGTFARNLAGNGNGTQMNWNPGGGFAAVGGKLTLIINGNSLTTLTWGSGNFIGNGSSALVFGATNANAQVELTNYINFNTADNFMRTIYVEKGLGGDSALLSGQLSGTSGFSKQGGGTLIISNAGNTFGTGTIGLTAVNNGTLYVQGNGSANGSASALGGGTSAITVGDNGGAGATAAPTGADIAFLVGGGNYTIARNINFTATGNTINSMTLGGATDNYLTYSGLISAAQGLRVSQVATTGTDALNITNGITTSNNAAVNFTNAGLVNVTGSFAGNGSMIQSGTGTTILAGNSTYTGATTVNAGKLRVTGTISSSAVTVTATGASNAATLSGNGLISQSVTTTGTNLTVGTAHLAPGVNSTGTNNNFGGAGTLSIGAGLTIGNGTNLDFDLGASGNDLIAVTGTVSLGSNVVLNVNQNGAITLGSAITLISYTGAQPNDTNLASWTTAFLPAGATNYTFADTGSAITITFNAPVTNNSTLAVTPSPISLGNVLVGATPASVTGTLTNNGTVGTGTYTIVATGSANASGSGTLAANGGSTTFTVGTTGTLGGNSGNNVVVGTVGASNSANVTGSAAPVNVTANLFQTASLTAATVSGTTLQLTNAASTDGGQRAGVTVTSFTPSNANFQITTQNSGTVGVTTTSDSTVTVATVDVKTDRLSGTYVYNGTVTGSLQYTDAALAAQGSVANQTWTGVSVTKVVTGATSSGTTDIKHAAITSGSSYAGYGLTSGVTGGKGQPTTPTVAQILAGTASGDTVVNMAFSADGGHPQSIFQSSDTLSLSGINQIGNGGALHDNSILTDTFVLQISYVSNSNVDNTGGVYYIGWWDSTRGAWVNAIAGNSNSNLPTDYVGTGAFAGTYASYDTAFRAAHPEDNTDALVLAGELGAYGYDSGTQVAWAVLNHNSEFEVIPEPSTYAMIFSGFGMLIGIQRFRRKSGRK